MAFCFNQGPHCLYSPLRTIQIKLFSFHPDFNYFLLATTHSRPCCSVLTLKALRMDFLFKTTLLTFSIVYGQSVRAVASEAPRVSHRQRVLLELPANKPEAAEPVPVARISLYSSRVRPLKLVSRGRGYWSQGRGEKGGEG